MPSWIEHFIMHTDYLYLEILKESFAETGPSLDIEL